MDSNIGALSKIYAPFSGKSLVGKTDHPGKVMNKKKNIHPCGPLVSMLLKADTVVIRKVQRRGESNKQLFV